MNNTHQILAADIGGTNSRFAIFNYNPEQLEASMPGTSADNGHGLELVAERWFLTAESPSFSCLVEYAIAALDNGKIEKESGIPRIDSASFAVAGPVTGEVCRAPNISWNIDLKEGKTVAGTEHAYLLNDFAAQGYACLYSELSGLTEILPGTPSLTHPKALLGAGTGFGKAIILPESSGASDPVLSTEGGHANFPFVGAAENSFALWMQQQSGQDEVIGDMILSGLGLQYLFFYHTGKQLPAHEIPPFLQEYPLVLDWLARFLGRACRNFALDTLSLGGVLVTGGLASYIPELLRHPTFAAAFRKSNSQADTLAKIPVHHVGNQSLGLWGAAVYATKMLKAKS